MNSLKKIITLSKSLAIRIINHEDIDKSDLKNSFSEEDYKEIHERLSNPTTIKMHEERLEDVNKTKRDDWKRIKPVERDSKEINFSFIFRVAAILIVSLTAGYFYLQDDNALEINTPISSSDNVVLDLGNGNTKTISSLEENFIEDAALLTNDNGFLLDYSKSMIRFPDKLIYNEIIVPYGNRFQIVLSDGSKVQLNAGSTLKYPVHFIKGQNRTVHLEGEAYFEVEKNESEPFIVNSGNMNVTVLGTEFNVSAYPEDQNIRTVLIEGSVKINASDPLSNVQEVILKPGQKGIWKKETSEIKVRDVKTYLHTAWTNGKIVFEHMAFDNILKKLERHYNVEIINKNKGLSNQKFTATFDVENINQVLTSFSKNYYFEFSINENKITIN